MKITTTNKDFFDQLAPEYDQMISFEKAVENKKKILSKFVTPEMKFAADLGCGSGVDSIALTSLGLEVDAFDPSTEMIKYAEANAKREGMAINFHNYPIDAIPKDFNYKIDFAVSLGNTFANIERVKFDLSIKKSYNILTRGGKLLIHIINYERVVAEKQRIVSITKGNKKFFIRFYDFNNDELVFNILSFNIEKPSEHKLISTKLFPYKQDDLIIALKKTGFSSIKFFSDFKLSAFNNKRSKDLIVRASKN